MELCCPSTCPSSLKRLGLERRIEQVDKARTAGLTMASKTVIVTGATGLLGRQVVRAFERRGWTVKGTGFSRADGASILKVDLGNEHDVEKMLDTIKSVRWRLHA